MSDMVAAGEIFGGGSDGFGVDVGFADDRAVLTIRGEIDLMTAPTLDTIVAALIDHGHRDLVLDASAIEFMDAAGLRVLVATHNRLRATGDALVVRAPSEALTRLLKVSRVADLVRVEPASTPGAERPAHERALTVDRANHADERVVGSFIRASTIPAGQDVVDAALRLVAMLARATIAAADGVSVSLRRHGRIATVAASDDTIVEMDRHQYETGQGPCLSAAGEGRPFHITSLGEEQRWPAFTPQALEQGINSILSNPLVTPSGPVGALNMYSRAPEAFAMRDQELASLFATHASAIVTHAAVDASADQISRRLQEALQTRALIAQAQGVLMGREGMTADEAYNVLRRFSRATSVPLSERARQVVATAQSTSDA